MKFSSRLFREYALPDGSTEAYDGKPKLFRCEEDPAVIYSVEIAPGSLWIWPSHPTYNNRVYMFYPQEMIDRYDLTPAFTSAANGGWISASYYLTRSPRINNSTSWFSVRYNGAAGDSNADSTYLIAPSFSI